MAAAGLLTDAARLLGWLSEPPGRVTGMTVGSYDQLTATEDLGEGMLMMRVPEFKLLSSKKAASDPRACLISFVFQEGVFPDDLSELATLLMHERALGQRSTFHPWLRMLPQSQSTLMWSPSEMGCLRGSPLVRLTQIREDQLRREYDKLFAHLRATFGQSLFPEASGFGFVDYRWARLTAEARSLPLTLAAGQPTHPVMVPLLDFAPSDPLADWARTSFAKCEPVKPASCEGCGDQRIFEVYARRGVSEDEVLGLGWGEPQCNWQNMLVRGTSHLDNPHDCVPLQLPLFPAADPTTPSRQKLVRARGLPENGIVQVRMGEVHEGSLMWMRVGALSDDELQCLEMMGGAWRNKSVSLANERVALSALRALLGEAAAGYVVPQNDAATIAEGVPGVPWRQLQCAKLRHSERSILLMFELFTARTAGLIAGFFEQQLRRGDAGAILRKRTAGSLESYLRVTVDPLLELERDAAVAEETAARGIATSLLDT